MESKCYYGDYVYKVLNDGTVEILSFDNKNCTEITIPEKLDGYLVSSVKNNFRGIGLRHIHVDESHPFLLDINGVLISKKDMSLLVFPKAYPQKSFDIPNGIVSIGKSAFLSCDNLREITMPDSVVSIGKKAFYACVKLASVSFSNRLIHIGDCAFQQCISLTQITLPDSVHTIGANPFCDCFKLMSIIVSDEHPHLEVTGGAFIHKQEKRLITHLFSVFTDEYLIPEGILTIGDSSFEGTTVQNIKIPHGVITIGESAFSYSDLRKIVIPASVKKIGDYAFHHCREIQSVEIQNGVISIGADAFSECDSLHNELIIPCSVKYIGKSAFSSCYALQEVTILDGTAFIGEEGFAYCSPYITITIPASVKQIGDMAFEMWLDDYVKWTPTLRLTKGSYAESYAEQNQITYEYID